MANLSELTRKEQVLAVLRSNINQWVDGSALANEQVGGSEGLRRVRDLKNEGYLIQERPHPDHTRAVHQYRLVEQTTVDGGTSDRVYTPPRREAPNGGSPGYYAAPRSNPPSRPAPAPKNTELERSTWKRESALRKEYRREFWVRGPKQRYIGTVAADFDGSRWFWSLKRPAFNGKTAPPRPEKMLGSGIVSTPGGEGLMAAMMACEQRFREIKERGE